MGDAYPAVAFAELIGMSHYGQCIGTGGHVFAVNAHVGTGDAFRADHTGVIGHVESVVGQEEVVVAIAVNDFGTFTGLPAVTCLAGGDQLTILGRCLACSPRLAQSFGRLACFAIELESGYAAMP